MSRFALLMGLMVTAVVWAEPRSYPIPPSGPGRSWVRPGPVPPPRPYYKEPDPYLAPAPPPPKESNPPAQSRPTTTAPPPPLVAPNQPVPFRPSLPPERGVPVRPATPPPKKPVVVEEPAPPVNVYVPLDREERSRIQRLAENLVELTVECQLDVLDRYSLCDLDRHAREQAGTLHKLSLPYQIGYGRLKLLRAHAEALKKLSANISQDAEKTLIAKYAEFQLRLSAMDWFLEETSSRAKRKFYNEYSQIWRQMDEFQQDWIPESVSPSGREKTLWSLLWADLEVWVQNAPLVAPKVTPLRTKLIETELPRVKALLEERSESKQVARTILGITARIAMHYNSMSGSAEDVLGVRKDFDAFTFFLGANENALDFSVALLR